jgi:hypothetical protein
VKYPIKSSSGQGYRFFSMVGVLAFFKRRGSPCPDLISTSYMERTDLTVRLFNRRFTRLTLGYSKKFEYLIHSINLMIFYYNFVWVHGTHGKTPAQAIGLKADAMTFEDLLMWQD